MKKLFGGIKLTWVRLIIMAVIAGVFTAVMALIPGLKYTSFNAITVSFEVWILFGIFIIMNSRSNKDSALKCFVFFLISQPLVYLIQVPFNRFGWGIFDYYKPWFVWTVFCLPMGFIGYYMKKDKWWGYLILAPMIGLTAYSFYQYFALFLFSAPRYILISLFCVLAMLLYPNVVFKDKKIRLVGTIISAVLIVAIVVVCMINPIVYRTEILGDNEEHPFDDTCSVSLEDGSMGTVEIVRMEGVDGYMVHGEFKKAGTTKLVIESPDGEKQVFELQVESSNYVLTAE